MFNLYPWNWTGNIWRAWDHFGIFVGNIVLVATIIAVIWGWLRRDSVRNWFLNNKFPEVGEEFSKVRDQLSGIVFTVSHAELPLWLIEKIKPRAVALIVTKESVKCASKIETACKTANIVYRISSPVNVDVPEETKRETVQMLNWLKNTERCERDCIGVDVTGGKVPMSLGAFMAAEEAGVLTLYVSSQFDRSLQGITPGSQKPLVISKPLAGVS